VRRRGGSFIVSPRVSGVFPVSLLLRIARLIDWINERVGRSVMWLVLIAVVISAGNALARKLFNTSSNALLEIQWYLFAAIFMLAAGYTFLRNEHVRIDILTSRLSPRGQNIVDVIGILFFMLPMAVLILWLSLPIVMTSIQSGEMSQNYGGLIRWPVYAAAAAGPGPAGAAGPLRTDQAHRFPDWARTESAGEEIRRCRNGGTGRCDQGEQCQDR